LVIGWKDGWVHLVLEFGREKERFIPCWGKSPNPNLSSPTLITMLPVAYSPTVFQLLESYCCFSRSQEICEKICEQCLLFVLLDDLFQFSHNHSASSTL
jgi:hypothetical protein